MKGDRVSDTLQLDNFTVKNFEFGIATSSNSFATFGIGPKAREGPNHDNLPYALAKAGYIKSAAYSLWLNDRHASNGSILFGGVDTAKYKGELETLPIVSESGSYTGLQVALSGLNISDGKGSSQDLGLAEPAAAALDCSSQYAFLPVISFKV